MEFQIFLNNFWHYEGHSAGYGLLTACFQNSTAGISRTCPSIQLEWEKLRLSTLRRWTRTGDPWDMIYSASYKAGIMAFLLWSFIYQRKFNLVSTTIIPCEGQHEDFRCGNVNVANAKYLTNQLTPAFHHSTKKHVRSIYQVTLDTVNSFKSPNAPEILKWSTQVISCMRIPLHWKCDMRPGEHPSSGTLQPHKIRLGSRTAKNETGYNDKDDCDRWRYITTVFEGVK